MAGWFREQSIRRLIIQPIMMEIIRMITVNIRLSDGIVLQVHSKPSPFLIH